MILTTEHLILRDFEESDWQAVLKYQSDQEYLRYYPWTHRTELEVRAFVHMFMNWSQEQPRKKFQLAIVQRTDGRLIGNCGIRKANEHILEAELGYELDRDYWGRGYATEAARALLALGFTQLGLHRVWAHCIAENTASAHVLEKIGMRYEGCLLENEWMKNRWWSTFLYASLEREWQAQNRPGR